MFLRKWLSRRRPPSQIASEVQKVNEQAERLRRLVAELKQQRRAT